MVELDVSTIDRLVVDDVLSPSLPANQFFDRLFSILSGEEERQTELIEINDENLGAVVILSRTDRLITVRSHNYDKHVAYCLNTSCETALLRMCLFVGMDGIFLLDPLSDDDIDLKIQLAKINAMPPKSLVRDNVSEVFNFGEKSLGFSEKRTEKLVERLGPDTAAHAAFDAIAEEFPGFEQIRGVRFKCPGGESMTLDIKLDFLHRFLIFKGTRGDNISFNRCNSLRALGVSFRVHEKYMEMTARGQTIYLFSINESSEGTDVSLPEYIGADACVAALSNLDRGTLIRLALHGELPTAENIDGKRMYHRKTFFEEIRRHEILNEL